MPRPAPKNQPSKFARYRERKRAEGKKLLRMWVLDPNAPGFAEQVAREAPLLRGAPEEEEALAFIEAVMADSDLPPYDWPTEDSKTDKNSSK